MIDAGELEIARDELLWLIRDCQDFIEAHCLLGQLALIGNDLPLARGHFGYAYRLGLGALPAGKAPGMVPYRLSANRAFFESGKGLAWSLEQLGKRELALEVVDTLLALDPDDPLGLAEMQTRLAQGDEPAAK